MRLALSAPDRDCFLAGPYDDMVASGEKRSDEKARRLASDERGGGG